MTGDDLDRIERELGIKLPAAYRNLMTRFPVPAWWVRGTRVDFSPEQVAMLRELIEGLEPGIHGRPRRWADGDESWRKVSRCA